MSDAPIVHALRSALSEQMKEQNSIQNSLQANKLVDNLITAEFPLDLIESCDLLERACAAGNLYVVQALCKYVDFFIYRSFALVLALRCGHTEVAKWLIQHEQVDLLAPIQRPIRMSVMLPPDTTFTRSALTKASTYLFLNPLDPTPSTYILRPFSGFEQLLEPSYRCSFRMKDAAKATHEIVGMGIVDNTVFDDIFRAYLVSAARKFRDKRDEEDLNDAQICLDEAAYMLKLHKEKNGEEGFGDERLYDILESIIVPGTSSEIYDFLAKDASDFLLAKLHEYTWLQDEDELIAPLISMLSPSSNTKHNGTLIYVMAKHNRLNELKALEAWKDSIDNHSYERAIEIASDLEHIEVATYLVSQMQKHVVAQCSESLEPSSLLDDLML